MKNKIITIILSLTSLISIFIILSVNKSDISTGVNREYKSDYIEIYDDETALSAYASELNDLTVDIFNKCNEERIKNNMQPLQFSASLYNCALIRAEEITRLWSHTRPDGTDWWTVNSDIMYGENLAKGFNNANDIVNAWMESKEHRDNILNSEFKSSAIYVYEFNGKYYIAQEFSYNQVQ